MTRISFIPNINLRELPKTIPQALKTIDVKVGACFALAFGVVLLLVITKMMQNCQSKPLDKSLQKRAAAQPDIGKATTDSLGFSSSDLNQTVKTFSRSGIPQEWTFDEVCSWTLLAIQKEFIDQGSSLSIYKIDSGQILDYLDYGLEKSYKDASETERAKSWIHKILTKLREKNYIRTFEITKSPSGSLVVSIQVKDLPTSTATKPAEKESDSADKQSHPTERTHALDSPALMSRPDLKSAKSTDLGFSNEILTLKVQVSTVYGKKEWTFSRVCKDTIEAIQRESISQSGSKLIINSNKSGHIIDFLNFGLPEGTTYQDAPERSNSWIDIILTQLSTKHYIAGFEIGQSALETPQITITLPR